MKKKLLFAITALMMLSLAVVAFAYTRSSTVAETAKMSCCGDSCPMKDKQNASSEKTSCDCCGDSCPMKGKQNAAGEKAACDCCGDSCPMMKKTDAKVENAVAAETTADAKKASGCSCCKHKNDAATAPAV